MPPDLPAPMPEVTVTVFNSIKLPYDGTAVQVGGPTHRAVFAHLVILEGSWISRGDLIQRVWDGREEPLGADDDLQRKVVGIRRALEKVGFGEDCLVAAHRGYRLSLPPTADFQLFRTQARRAQEIAEQNPGRAADAMQQALDLIEGSPLPGIAGDKAEAFRQRMAEERDEARRLLERWSLQDGRHRQRIPLLKQTLAENPFDQELAGYLMYALAGLGRHKDALTIYGQMRARLAQEDLSIDPGLTAALRRIRNGAVQYGIPAPEQPVNDTTGQEEMSEEPDEEKTESAAPSAEEHTDESVPPPAIVNRICKVSGYGVQIGNIIR